MWGGRGRCCWPRWPMVAAALAPAAAQPQPKANDIGITDSEIRIAVVADVDNPVVPALFKSGVDAVQAWAKTVNQQGGIAGRKVVVDFIDSRLSPNDARNALITACSQDFALVGTEALFITNVSDLETCNNVQGQPVGIPDLSGIATLGRALFAGDLLPQQRRRRPRDQGRPPADVHRGAGRLPLLRQDEQGSPRHLARAPWTSRT